MKGLGRPCGRLEAIGFLKGESGFFVGPNAIFRYRKELGLDRNHVLVLMSLVGHVRPDASDFAEASYSVIQRDTGLHKQVVLRCIKEMEAPLGTDVAVRKRNRMAAGAASVTVSARAKGLGVLARVPSSRSMKTRGKKPAYVWRDGGPKLDTNVYTLVPLAQRLLALIKSKRGENAPEPRRGWFGQPKFDWDPDAECTAPEAPPAIATSSMQRVDSCPTQNEPVPKTRFGSPRFDV